MSRTGPIFICGPDETPGTRDECPDSLHDHPLPDSYLGAAEVAGQRLRAGWGHRRCEQCGLYGWIKPGRLARLA